MTENATLAPGSVIRQIARQAAWAPLAVLVSHEVGGRLFGHEPYVDPTMHLMGGTAAAFFFRQASSIAGDLLGAPGPAALDLIAFGLTCAAALFWEFGEFVAHEIFGAEVQRGLENTMRDLALGVMGAVVYLAARRLMDRRHKGSG